MKIVLEPGAFKPERAHTQDAGLDLFTPEDILIPAYDRKCVDTRVRVEIPYGFVGLLTSKSGLMRDSGIISSGTIDSGYTGTIRAILINTSYEARFFKKGSKITQLLVLPCITPLVEIVDALPETERGENGFGSTGV